MKIYSAVSIFIALSSAVSMASTQKCLKIGLLGEFEKKPGSFSQPFGKEILRGSELAKKASSTCIEFEQIDIANSIANIDSLIRLGSARGTKIFLGLGNSEAALAARTAINETKSLLITPTASSDALTVQPSRTILMFPTNSKIASRIVQELKKRKVKSVVSIFSAHNAYSENMNKVFKEEFKKVGGEVFEFGVRSGRIDLRPIIADIKSHLKGYVFLPVFELDDAKIIAELSRSEMKPTYIGTDSWGTYSTTIKNLLKNSSVTALVPQIYDPGARFERNEQFVKAYKDNFSEPPTDLSAFSYDGVNLAIEIQESCPLLDQDLELCLSKLKSFQTTMGESKLSKDLTSNPKTSLKFINLMSAHE